MMMGTREVMKITGMSKSRCLQFARMNGVLKIGQSYVWSDRDVEAFMARIGQRGKRPDSCSDAQC